jgi:hypothetical protein
MSSSMLDILCHATARRSPHLYQADKKGDIRLVWDYAGPRADYGSREVEPPPGSRAAARMPVDDAGKERRGSLTRSVYVSLT